MGVVDLLTSPSSFTGEESDLLIADFFGVGDLLTSADGTTGGDVNLFTSPDSEEAGGVVDLLTSERGATGSVGTYLLGSEMVERGGGGREGGTLWVGRGRGATTAGEEVEEERR